MAVAEGDLHRIAADRFELRDGDVALAPDQLFLAGAMPLHFGAGAHHPEILGVQRMALAAVKGHMEHAPLVGNAQFLRPRIIHG